MKIADAAVSQSNRRYYNKPIVHHYGKSIVVQKVKIARSCPALHTLSVTIVTYAVTTLFPYFNIIFNLVSSCIWKERKTNKQYSIQTLEKTESAIKYGKSRETGNIGYSRHRMKTNKKPKKTQRRKLKR